MRKIASHESALYFGYCGAPRRTALVAQAFLRPLKKAAYCISRKSVMDILAHTETPPTACEIRGVRYL